MASFESDHDPFGARPRSGLGTYHAVAQQHGHHDRPTSGHEQRSIPPTPCVMAAPAPGGGVTALSLPTPYHEAQSSPTLPPPLHYHHRPPPEYHVTGGFADTPVISASFPTHPPFASSVNPEGGPLLVVTDDYGVMNGPAKAHDTGCGDANGTGEAGAIDHVSGVASAVATAPGAHPAAQPHQPEPNPSFCRLSLLALIVAGVVFSGVTAAGQVLVHEGFHSLQITIIRAIGLVSFTLFQLSRSGEVPVPRDRVTGEFVAVGHCIMYGVLSCVDFGVVFMAAKWLPLTEVLALWSLNPIFAAFTARVWLGEPVTAVHVAGIFVFLGGAICAVDPATTFGGGETSDDVWIGRGLAFVGAILSGIRIVIPRRIFAAGHVSVLAPPFWMGLMGLLMPVAVSFPLEFKGGLTQHDWPLYLAILATAVGSFVGQSLLGYAMPRESAVVLGVLWNLFAVFGLIWQPVVFGIDPTMYQYISVALVTVGGGVVGAEPQIAAIAYRCLGRAPPSSVVINVTTTTGASTTAVDKKTDDCAPRPPSDDARAALMRHPTPATALSRRPAASTPHDPMGTDRELTSVEV
uniref:EamA domain-containing protein n=1 Tax=Neobodo designis TaxID=312471 RepID=A0A7S1QAX1_NEODS|mmetsp:Transcript_37134/g.114687  ORF Transcript_37134/g.114687 Transcript_37134/m.114687 type:complete len:576 (+) Transcript_37134:175-1902(+)